MNAEETTKPIAARAGLLASAGYFDADSDEVIPSPCISVCRMAPDQSHCEGCFRTVAEIRAWASADSAARLAIWARLAQRAGFVFPARAESPAPQTHPAEGSSAGKP
ncbi:DUF1289 domain-containing protein [Extensimonas vulgaris]|uniref:Uncharacterized protein n=1 Tax=Extensimonas vulgaris TaxID=1031594 RepID=A0A369AM43_9BURK|nr:DUF1289 domain-containing protein [Extensimonas vulgaris]RCX10145.1 hypothetical protein DFR45_103129 [Extensimonas vulgaris]TWI39726.1 hypothetical protein IP95_00956 [Extensimonas vulgaris]TXD17294.1 DUF1289 domain-containing protein [Extensimonas vulgaris]